MKRTGHYWNQRTKEIPWPGDGNMEVSGSLVGKASGVIDVTAQVAGKDPDVHHAVTFEMTLERAKQVAQDILSEVAEIEHRLTTGKWKYEVEAEAKGEETFASKRQAEEKTHECDNLDCVGYTEGK